MPVKLVTTPLAGVPNAGVVNVGEVRVLFVSVCVPAVVATSTAPVVSLDYTDTVTSTARAEKVT